MASNWREYISNQSYKSDNLALREFCELYMLAFKQKNLSEGINVAQALWVHHRVRAWPVTLPPEMGGLSYTVDVLNMIVSGDVEVATLSLMHGTPDDMSEPYHWLSAERISWLVEGLTEFLGWS